MRELWAAFHRTYGYVSTIVGLALSFIPIFFDSIPFALKLILPIAIIFLVIFATFVEGFRYLYHEKSHLLPAVIRGLPASGLYAKASAILLLSSSPFFAYDTYVSIYIHDDEYEKMIGWGKVINIQENQKLQVAVYASSDDGPDLWNGITGNNSTVIKRLIVKPSIPTTLTEGA